MLRYRHQACDCPCYAMDCPKKKALNALTAKYEEQHEEPQEVTCKGSFQMLGTIKAKSKTSKSDTKGPMYIDVMMNRVATQAWVDTGASHNFVTIKEANILGVNVKKEEGSLKVVNSIDKLIHGIAKEVCTTM